jgi:predicted RND superfamily exporter protein
MKLDGINRRFTQFGTFQIRRRWVIIAALAVLTIIGLAGLPKLTTGDNMEDWFDDYETIQVNTDRFEALFGNEDQVLALVRAEDVFDPEVLAMIRDLGAELLEKVPYAKELRSLTDISVSFGTEEGIEVKSPFEDGIPPAGPEREERRAYILSRSSLVNMLVSDDCRETWLALSLYNYEGVLFLYMRLFKNFRFWNNSHRFMLVYLNIKMKKTGVADKKAGRRLLPVAFL